MDTDEHGLHEFLNRQGAKDANAARVQSKAPPFGLLRGLRATQENSTRVLTAKTPRAQKRPEGRISREEREGSEGSKQNSPFGLLRGLRATRKYSTRVSGSQWPVVAAKRRNDRHEYHEFSLISKRGKRINRQDAKDVEKTKVRHYTDAATAERQRTPAREDSRPTKHVTFYWPW